jgi:succinate dehydrogenase/fumarate reductase cytochrome b subunit
VGARLEFVAVHGVIGLWIAAWNWGGVGASR